MISQTFGDMLFYPKSESLPEFPSPEELKYRVIISTKPPKEYLESKSSNNSRKEKDSDEDISVRVASYLTVDRESNDKVVNIKFV